MSQKQIAIITSIVLPLIALITIGCQSEQISPTQALANSSQQLSEIDTFQMSFDGTWIIDEVRTTFASSAGYEGSELAYSTFTFEFEVAGEKLPGAPKMLFVSPDLYFLTPEDDWYVLSPWNQGIRPDELPDINLDEDLFSYETMVRELSELNELPGEEIDGEPMRRYIGEIDLSDSEAGGIGSLLEGFEGSGEIDIWMYRNTFLPRRIRVQGNLFEDIAADGVVDATIEMFGYNEPLDPPNRPETVRPWRDFDLPDAPCTGPEFAGCLPAQDELSSLASDSCDGSERRICLVPLGQIRADLVEHLADYYATEYGIPVTIMKPLAVPQHIADPLREQVEAATLIRYIEDVYPSIFADASAVVIGITPLDMFDETSHFRYLFGLKRTYQEPEAIVSTFRMDPLTYGDPPSDDLLFSRTRKMMTKYVGLLYYGLRVRTDPSSAMYNNILGPADLDNMDDALDLTSPR